jgi:hypothetical protein
MKRVGATGPQHSRHVVQPDLPMNPMEQPGSPGNREAPRPLVRVETRPAERMPQEAWGLVCRLEPDLPRARGTRKPHGHCRKPA